MAALSLVMAVALVGDASVGASPVGRWQPLIAEASQRFGVSESIVASVIRAESGGRTTLNGRPITSRAGAMGLMQLMPGTWAELRSELRLGPDPYDPRDNILAGTLYLRKLGDRFGYPGMIAAYNAGPARYAAYLARRQRLPAETVAYAHAGIQLVADTDYCTPEDLRRSTLLIELEDMTEPVSEEENAAWAARPNPITEMQESQNAILEVARRLDSTVENFTDLDRLVQTRPERDDEIAMAYRDSGYLELWKTDFRVNPWHYDLDEIEALTTVSTIDDLRDYCIGTIREFHSGGLRYAVNLVHYTRALRANNRQTIAQLVALYERLVHNDQLRRDTALAWLRRHFPDDAKNNLERIVPHSDQWFSIVDRVEPALGQIARLSIDRMKSHEVCSACGDPAGDYLLVNAAEMMPGVPSLRLCLDCVEIRRAGGEILRPLWDQ